MDWLMLCWVVVALFSSIFHKDPSSALVYRLGIVFNTCGVYFIIRVFVQSIEDINALCISIAVLLLPVAVMMFFEKMTAYNVFSIFGGVVDISEIRAGRIRAQGPFSHSILAGTVGAVCLPLMVGPWKERRNPAFLGIVACLAMVFTSSSSGPIMSTMMGIVGLFMWRFRQQMRFVRWMAFLGIIAVDIVMKAPAYYLLQRIDLVGGSTGWHRAALIESALNHLNEWWLAGTDYTRHWMPTGLAFSPDQTDITNHYLHLGVVGGLPLMILFIVILVRGFSFVGQILKQSSDLPASSQFMLWALGSALFAHTVTCIGVSYFDQSFLFLYLTLAAISSAYSISIKVMTPWPSHRSS